MRNQSMNGFLWKLGAVALALIFTTLVLLASGAPPLEAYKSIINGIFPLAGDTVSRVSKLSDILVVWVPLALVTSGLLITFTAGLWNIGIEGQITLGAVGTTWALRLLQDSGMSAGLIIFLAILAGMVGGAFWAALTGALKTFGGVNEIFGGLGMNFVAIAFSLWLIFGPWKRPGVASMSGTEPFPELLWLPTLAGMRLSPWALVLAFAGIILVYFMLRGTYFGLKLKAVGKNPKAAFLFGIPTWQYMMLSFMICGAFAGAAGAMQVVSVYHRLIPSISSGYGYMGLMVAMLVNFSPLWAPFVAFLFAALNIGSIQLPIVLKLDSSLAGVIQGTIVLMVLLVEGMRQKYFQKKAR
jgi:general nucleoside transport system permease protein